ncbi:MAG TPA: transcriptional repressor [Firmicutes bacterium]|jgi:Fur family transcriptional regulator, peroxide stress response regulator|nr:transcriptional repressor [Bacillota bacterium]
MQKINVEESMDSFYQKCADHNLKVTPQRVFIYQELLKATDHPSIDDVFNRVRNQLPNISFDTVYRTALSLADLGIIDIIESGGPKRFDANISLHHHFHCLKCQKIIDFDCEYYDQITVPKELQSRFKIFNQRVVLEGLCADCDKS